MGKNPYLCIGFNPISPMSLQQHIPRGDSLTRSVPVLPGSVAQEQYLSVGIVGADSAGVATASPESVFGPGNRLNTDLTVRDTPRQEATPENVNVYVLNGLLIALFIAYAYLVFRFRSQIVLLAKASLIKGYLNNIIEEQSVTFRSFITAFNIIGVGSLLAFTVKAYLLWAEQGAVPERITDYIPFIAPTLLGVILSILLYRRIINAAISKLSMQRNLIAQIQLFNRIVFTFFSLIITPLIVFFGLTDMPLGSVELTVIVILLVILLLYYLVKSFSFFVERKISILQWFLYLCAVEIWPISFYVLFALRDFQL